MVLVVQERLLREMDQMVSIGAMIFLKLLQDIPIYGWLGKFSSLFLILPI